MRWNVFTQKRLAVFYLKAWAFMKINHQVNAKGLKFFHMQASTEFAELNFDFYLEKFSRKALDKWR